MNESLKKKQKQRVAFLNKLYEISDGDTDQFINGGELAVQLGYEDGDEDEVRNIANYLAGEHLIKVEHFVGGFPGLVQLTHFGLKEIESALGAPEKATEHFMPINILNIENMVGSNIQQGNIGSEQNVTISNEARPQIEAFFQELKQALPALSLDETQSQELNADIGTAELQLSSPKPNSPILRESLSSIKRVLEAGVGGALGIELASKIPPLLALV